MDAKTIRGSSAAPLRFAERVASAPCSASASCRRAVTTMCLWTEHPGGEVIVEPACDAHVAAIRDLVRSAGGFWYRDLPRADLASALGELVDTGRSLVLPPPHGRYSAELRLDPRGFAVGGSSRAEASETPRRVALLIAFGFALEVAILARFAAGFAARDALGAALTMATLGLSWVVVVVDRRHRGHTGLAAWLAALMLLGSLAVLAVIAVGR